MADFTDPENTRSHRLAARPPAVEEGFPFVDDGPGEFFTGDDGQVEPFAEDDRKKRRVRGGQAADGDTARSRRPEAASSGKSEATQARKSGATQARNPDAAQSRRPEADRPREPEKEPRRRSFRLEEYAGQVLSGNILTRAEVRRQYPYIFFMALLMLLYIANGYHIQKLHRQHDKLTEQIKELRSRSLTLSSIRMTATRQSEIIRELDARGIPLRESLSPPKVIEK